MEIKYLYCISKTKVDMLLKQFRHKRLRMPTITPKIEFAGLSLSADFKGQASDSLIQDTLSLLDSLERGEL